jgi:uncharacterized protein YciI
MSGNEAAGSDHLFVVIRSRGEAWRDSRTLEEQEGWDAHAAFMDSLAEKGFVLLVGPLEDTRDALLVVRAKTRDEILARLADDPWTRSGLLTTGRISSWTLRIGSLP